MILGVKKKRLRPLDLTYLYTYRDNRDLKVCETDSHN